MHGKPQNLFAVESLHKTRQLRNLLASCILGVNTRVHAKLQIKNFAKISDKPKSCCIIFSCSLCLCLPACLAVCLSVSVFLSVSVCLCLSVSVCLCLWLQTSQTCCFQGFWSKLCFAGVCTYEPTTERRKQGPNAPDSLEWTRACCFPTFLSQLAFEADKYLSANNRTEKKTPNRRNFF